MSMQSTTRTNAPARTRLATTCFGVGLVAALLTTTLSFLSLVLGVAAIACGVAGARRVGLDVWSAAGLGMAGTSLYVVVLEILVLGG